MNYTQLGRTGMKVSRLCLGTMNFGPETNEGEAFRIMDAALEAGVNFFDTANVYGGRDRRGWTEEIIGRWFAQGGGRRERVVLATKVYGDMDPNDGPNNVGGLSKYKILRHVEASLHRLQTDHIDLYQMHHVDLNVTWDELWEAFETLTAQGKIGYVGASNFAGWHLVKAQAAAAQRNFLGLVSEQHKYNLLCRLPELEVLPAARDLGVGVIPWSPLAGGLLGGAALSSAAGSRTGRQAGAIAAHRPQLESFSKLCREIGETESVTALAWMLANPAVTSPIIGPRTLEQLQGALRSVEVELGKEFLMKLDEIFPGPGGPAPQAYAW